MAAKGPEKTAEPTGSRTRAENNKVEFPRALGQPSTTLSSPVAYSVSTNENRGILLSSLTNETKKNQNKMKGKQMTEAQVVVF